MWWQWVTKPALSNSMFRHLEILEDREEKQILRRSGCYALGDIWPCPLWPYIPVTRRTHQKHPWSLSFFTSWRQCAQKILSTWCPKIKVLIECYWSHRAQFQSPVVVKSMQARKPGLQAPSNLSGSKVKNTNFFPHQLLLRDVISNIGKRIAMLLVFFSTTKSRCFVLI